MIDQVVDRSFVVPGFQLLYSGDSGSRLLLPPFLSSHGNYRKKAKAHVSASSFALMGHAVAQSSAVKGGWRLEPASL